MMKAVVFACLVALAIASEEWKKAPTPIFLMGASDAAKEAFYNIITRDWTNEQKEQAIDKLISTLDAKVQEAYKKFKEEIAIVKAKYGETVEQQPINVIN